MRACAIVLSIMITALTAYAANAAVASAGVYRYLVGSVPLEDANRMAVWYGGRLEPITVIERRLPVPVYVTGTTDSARCDPSTMVVRPAAS